MSILVTCLTLSMASAVAANDGPADRWGLATADTRVVIRVTADRLLITQLGENSEPRHDWAESQISVRLMAKIWVAQNERPTAWTFKDVRLDHDAGTLTLTFVNREPKLTLRSVWRARPGHGPIEHWMEIENASGRRVTLFRHHYGVDASYWATLGYYEVQEKLRKAFPRVVLENHWDGLFYWSSPLKRGTLYIFRPNAAEDEQAAKLKGLEPKANYWLWCEDGSIMPGLFGGAALMTDGIATRLPRRYASDLIYVQDASFGKPKALEASAATKTSPASP